MDILRNVTPDSLLSHGGVCVMGLLVSGYALYVELKKSADKNYVAMCDFGENMSCSKVLTSEYSKGFGLTRYLFGNESSFNVPNCILGIVFYTIQFILGKLSYWWVPHFLFYTSAVSCVGSLYLAYILFFKLKDLCIVCLSTYVLNFLLLYVNWR